MVSSKPWVTMAATLGPFSSMRALVPSVVAYRTESTWERTWSRSSPARLQAKSRASLNPSARLWWVVKALASMHCSSQTKKQSVNVPPMSTEMRFMVVVSSRAQRSVDVGVRVLVPLDVIAGAVRDSGHRVGAALLPLDAQGVDVPDHVDGRRVARRYVLGLDLGGAARAIELEDAAIAGVGGEGELVPVRVDDRLMDLPRVTVVDQRLSLIVAAGVAEVVVAHPAHPPFGVQVDEQVLGHGNSHGRVAFRDLRGVRGQWVSVSMRSPEAVTSSFQPSSTRAVKNGPSTMAGPKAVAPGSWSRSE